MLTLTSKRHRYKFYLSLALGALFLMAISAALLLSFSLGLKSGPVKPKIYLLPLLSAGILFVAGYMLYKYYKNAPVIQLDARSVSFGNRTISWTDVTSIKLSGKFRFPFIIYFPMEATAIYFKDGSSLLIFDDMYQNAWQIKAFLQDVVIDKKTTQPPEVFEVRAEDLSSENFTIYKDNQFTSLRGIMLWGMFTVFFLIIMSKKISPPTSALLFLTGFGIFWFLLHSYMMHYFNCSDHFFVVKNHNLPWRTKRYRLKDIREMVFETQGKQPNCLRIITRDFKSKLYPASTLRDNTWLSMKADLERHHIPVRNECI